MKVRSPASSGVALDKIGGWEFDAAVKGDISRHISAFSKGHSHLVLLVEWIIDFKYNFKFEALFQRLCHGVHCLELR